jgi:hypothetical protein
MKRMPKMSTLLALSMLGALLGTSALAIGQDRRTGARPEAEAPRSGGDDEAEDQEAEAADASAEEREEGGSKVKVFEFSGLDISGRLKSPSLLYFLNRLRAEFDRPRLPHRSFTPRSCGTERCRQRRRSSAGAR